MSKSTGPLVNGNGRAAPKGGGRLTLKDLEGRVNELERKLVELSEQILKVDQRMQKMADLVAAAQASRY